LRSAPDHSSLARLRLTAEDPSASRATVHLAGGPSSGTPVAFPASTAAFKSFKSQISLPAPDQPSQNLITMKARSTDSYLDPEKQQKIVNVIKILLAVQ